MFGHTFVSKSVRTMECNENEITKYKYLRLLSYYQSCSVDMANGTITNLWLFL